MDQAEEKRRRQSRSRAAAEEVVADNPPRSIGGGGGPRDRGMTSGKRSGGGRYRVGVSSVRRMHVWCLVAPSRGGVLLLGETQASMYEDPFGALGVQSVTSHPGPGKTFVKLKPRIRQIRAFALPEGKAADRAQRARGRLPRSTAAAESDRSHGGGGRSRPAQQAESLPAPEPPCSRGSPRWR